MNKFTNGLANWVVNSRWWLLGFFLVLTVALFFVPQAGVNYDMTHYLPDNSETRAAIEIMRSEFDSAGTASVMVSNIDKTKITEMENAILGVKIDNKKMVASVSSKLSEDEKSVLFSVFFTESDYTDSTSKALDEIRKVLANGQYGSIAMTGSAVEASNSKNSIGSELSIILIIIIIVVLVILTLTSRSYLEPLVYLIVIGCAILLNMHTNAIMGDISYITKSISAIMLIALEMDYCIVLFSRFREERKHCDDPVQAMKQALSGSFVAVVSSACTVMAGLLALVVMDYKIGADVGLVLAKGVFISILAVLFLMPAVILMLNKLLDKTQHRSFLPRMDGVAKFSLRTRLIIPIIFTCVIAVGIVLQHGVNFTYTADPSKEGTQAYTENKTIETTFGKQNSLVVLVSNDNIEAERDVFQQIKSISSIDKDGKTIYYINSATSLTSTSDEQPVNAYSLLNSKEFYGLLNADHLADSSQPEIMDQSKINKLYKDMGKSGQSEYLIKTVSYLKTHIKNYGLNVLIQDGILSSPKLALLEKAYASLHRDDYNGHKGHDRMIFNINLDVPDEMAIKVIEKVKDILNDSVFKDDYYIVNATANVIETDKVFAKDKLVTDIVIVVLILLIVLLSFGSFSIPLLLVLTIQGAIWINLAISAVAGEAVYFICYLLAMAIQMGATIDYGILLTERYVRFRKDHTKLCAMTRALNTSLPTILSSGLILILSAFIIHFISSLPLLSEIGLLIGRGALISVISILFVLPQLLILFDKIIEKSSFRKLKFRQEGEPAPVVVEPEKVESKEVDDNDDNDDDLDFEDESSSKSKLAAAARTAPRSRVSTRTRATEAKSTATKTTTARKTSSTGARRVTVKVSKDTEDI